MGVRRLLIVIVSCIEDTKVTAAQSGKSWVSWSRCDEVRQIVDNSKLITSSVSGKVCLGNSLCVDNKYEGSNNIPKYGTSIQTHIPYTEYCGWIEVGKERRQDM